MPGIIWLLLLAGAGAAVVAKQSPSAFAGWKRLDLSKSQDVTINTAAAALVTIIRTTGQNAIMSPDGKLMAVRNGDIIEVYERK